MITAGNDSHLLDDMSVSQMHELTADLDSVGELIKSYGPNDLEVRPTDAGLIYIIKGPGKFEGEPLYLEWYWNRQEFADHEVDMNDTPPDDVDDYAGDYEGTMATIFELSNADFVLWPELINRKYVGFWVRDDGFVMELDNKECAELVESE